MIHLSPAQIQHTATTADEELLWGFREEKTLDYPLFFGLYTRYTLYMLL